MVEVFRDVRRVLRDDGVVWLNYGDCYAGSKESGGLSHRVDGGKPYHLEGMPLQRYSIPQGSLMMMPHRVALALQADGWIVRQDLVWSKSNPMPESLAGTRWIKHRIKEKRSEHARKHNIKGGTQKMLEDASVHQGINEDWVPEYVDCLGCEKCIPNDGLVLKRGSWRHTRAHEYVFMLTKKMQYWSNQEAVREDRAPPGPTNPRARYAGGIIPSEAKGVDGNQPSTRDGDYHNLGQRRPTSGRNPRSVLDVPTAPYKGAHYATFPPNLIAPLIRATCPRWACPVCGQGWAAVVEHSHVVASDSWGGKWSQADPQASARRMSSNTRARRESGESHDHPFPSPSVLGYRPTCEHPHTQEEAALGIVFDPFVGSGTTVKVAQDLLRKGIGIDISMEYLDLQAKVRIGQGSPSNVLDDLPLFQ